MMAVDSDGAALEGEGLRVPIFYVFAYNNITSKKEMGLRNA